MREIKKDGLFHNSINGQYSTERDTVWDYKNRCETTSRDDSTPSSRRSKRRRVRFEMFRAFIVHGSYARTNVSNAYSLDFKPTFYTARLWLRTQRESCQFRNEVFRSSRWIYAVQTLEYVFSKPLVYCVRVPDDRQYRRGSLVFGINHFSVLVIQSILTIIRVLARSAYTYVFQ